MDEGVEEMDDIMSFSYARLVSFIHGEHKTVKCSRRSGFLLLLGHPRHPHLSRLPLVSRNPSDDKSVHRLVDLMHK